MEISSQLSFNFSSCWAKRCRPAMTFWVEHSAHELYKLRACSRDLGLYCSLSHSQNLCCLTVGQAIQLAQLERCAHRRRKLLKELHEALTQLRFRTFLFGSWSAIRQP